MKVKNVFNKRFSMENLYLAYLDAAKGRRYHRDVLQFGYDVWASLEDLRARILSGGYSIDNYHAFYVFEPKKRMIMSIAFEHRVVQWAIYRVINPVLIKGYIRDSYGCIAGRGPLKAMLRLKDWIKYVSRKSGKWYYLKLDVSKYFYRISHVILKSILARKIKDKRLLEVLAAIIDCDHTPFGLPPGRSVEDTGQNEMLFDVGMPIGNLLSQLFANLYLNELDQFCKRTLQIKFYARYMDDVVILSDSKEQLHEWLAVISSFLNDRLELSLNRKTCIRPINQGLEFVGYRIWHNRVMRRKSTTLRMKRSVKGVKAAYRRGAISSERAFQTFQSFMGLIKYTDMRVFRERLLDSMVLTKGAG